MRCLTEHHVDQHHVFLLNFLLSSGAFSRKKFRPTEDSQPALTVRHCYYPFLTTSAYQSIKSSNSQQQASTLTLSIHDHTIEILFAMVGRNKQKYICRPEVQCGQ